jgi:hypothetical protein
LKHVLGEWPFLNSRERVNRGLLPLVERTPTGKLPTRTSDVAVPVGRLFHGGWRRSTCSYSVNPQSVISVRLLPVGDV